MDTLWKYRNALLFILIMMSILVLLYILSPISYRYQVEETDGTSLAEQEHFLSSEEGVLVTDGAGSIASSTVLPIHKVLFEYVEVLDGCDVHYEGECLLVRSGPGTEFPVVSRLRNDIVLKVGGQVERDGQLWYKIVFDEVLRYPERVTSDWYVAAEYVGVLEDEGDRTIWRDEIDATSTKKILIDLSDQTLIASQDGEIYMRATTSTGLESTPTPRGTFTVFKKTPSRYMQGPLPGLPSDQYYDLPGVPWNLYFTDGGAVIHGAYWHDSFGSTYSHGCVNLLPEAARILYNWAELGATVIVQD